MTNAERRTYLLRRQKELERELLSTVTDRRRRDAITAEYHDLVDELERIDRGEWKFPEG